MTKHLLYVKNDYFARFLYDDSKFATQFFIKSRITNINHFLNEKPKENYFECSITYVLFASICSEQGNCQWYNC